MHAQFILPIRGEVVKRNSSGAVTRNGLLFFRRNVGLLFLLLFLVRLSGNLLWLILRKVDRLLSAAARAFNRLLGRRGRRSTVRGRDPAVGDRAGGLKFRQDLLRGVLGACMVVEVRSVRAADFDVDVLGFLELHRLDVRCLPLAHGVLIRLACEEHGAVTDPERALLLLALCIDFGDGPRLDGVSLGLVGGRSNAVCRVDVRADRSCRLWRLKTCTEV